MLAAVIFFTTLGGCVAHNEGIALLGQSIYVPVTDLLGSIPSGINVSAAIPANCIDRVDEPITTEHEDYYKDTASLYSSITTDTGMDASFQADFSLSLTLNVVTRAISSTKRTVSGNSLNAVAKSFKESVSTDQTDCLSLLPVLVQDFEKLSDTIHEPWLPESWREYQIFLREYGSHIVTAVTYGSSIVQHAFAETSEKYSERDFTVKSCISLAGPGGIKNLDMSLCNNVTDEEISEVKNMEMSSSITIRGGTTKTRNQLVYNRSHELITQFLDEGQTNPSPILFELKPIWQVLQEKYKYRATDLIKAVNLEYFYMGFLNFGCPYQAEYGQDFQKFDMAEQATPEAPAYQCSLAPYGCHQYDDCHYHLGIWCACRGNTCIHYGQKTLDTGVKRTTAAPYYGSDWRAQGCDWKIWGSECACKHENHERKIIWSEASNAALFLFFNVIDFE